MYVQKLQPVMGHDTQHRPQKHQYSQNTGEERKMQRNVGNKNTASKAVA